MNLEVQTKLDPALLALPAEQLSSVLAQPTLFDLRQPDRDPLFISVLLHGNETSGWDAMRNLLVNLNTNRDPISLVLLVGNVVAAKDGRRSLDGQVDFNRIWEGGETPECLWANEVIDYVRSTNPWLAVDIHNNSSPNPHYSVITDLESDTLQTARHFSSLAILAHHPHGVLTRRCADFCPSITIEVGLPSDFLSAERAKNFVQNLVACGNVPQNPFDDLQIFLNRIRVVLGDAETLSDEQVPEFTPDLHQYNFKSLPSGTKIARLTSPRGRLMAIDEDMNDVSDEYFVYNGKSVSVRDDVIMSMYSDDPKIVRQDCVCYFLEPVEN